MKLMVVEDSTSMRKVLRTILRSLGFVNVHEAEDGADAWEQLREGGFDLLISDWNMPNMSGLELLENVRSHETTADLPVIMATSRTERDDVIAAMKAGANNYISKPFNPAQLKDKIDKVLQSFAAKQSHLEADRLDEVLLNSASLVASVGAQLPFVIFVERTTDPEVLKRPDSREVVRSILLKIDAFNKVNREHAGDQMAYVLEENGQDVMKIVRRGRSYIQLICIHTEKSLEGATLARLALLNHKVDYKVVLIAENMFDFDMTQRSNLRSMGAILVEEKDLTAERLEGLLTEHCPLIAGPKEGRDSASSASIEGGKAEPNGHNVEDGGTEPESLEQAMGRNESLPALPLFINRVLRLGHDSASATAGWVEAVEMDARCEHMILARAQMVSTGARKTDGDVAHAIGLLGKKQVRDLAAAVALYAPLDSTLADKGLAESFWRHGVAAGITARMLTMPFDGRKLSQYEQLFFDEWRPDGQVVSLLKQLNISSRFELAADELPFVGGLMHDIGQLAMASTYPSAFGQTLESLVAQNYLSSFLLTEHSVGADADHVRAGALLANRWQLSPALVRSIGGHHSPESGDHYTLLIALANFISTAVEPFPHGAQYPHVLIVEGLAGAMNPLVELSAAERDLLTEKFIPVTALEHVQMDVEKLLGLMAILSPSIKRMANRLARNMESAAQKRSSS